MQSTFAVPQENSKEDNDDVQTVITQMAALTAQSQLTANTTAETSASVAAAINQLNANQQAMQQQFAAMVKSTHICDLKIPGLPYVLERHIMPDLTVASLVGIRILCKLGCTVLFTDTACYVRYKGKVILTG